MAKNRGDGVDAFLHPLIAQLVLNGCTLLPQAFRGAITPLGNTLIALTKNTTVATAIGVAEVSGLMKEMQDAQPDLILPIFLVVAIGFVILTLPVGLLTTYLSNRLAVKR